MNKELQNLIVNSKNLDALARIFGYAADRLDKIRREIFPSRAQTADEQKDTKNEEGTAHAR